MPDRLSFDWQLVAGISLAALAGPVGMLLRGPVLRRLGRLAARTAWKADDVVVDSIRAPFPYWFAIAGAWAGARLAGVPDAARAPVNAGLAIALIVSLTVWAAGLGGRLLRVALTGGEDDGPPVTGVALHTVRFGIYALGGLVLLSTLGISVAPILTTVGIGGLAVALGLQDTLANLFAGVHVTLAGNIRVGDYIRVETGDEGFVEDIKWRATRIRTLPGNFVLMPNSRLAQSVVTNYHLPAKDLAVLVQVGVHYSSDLPMVERIAREVAREAQQSVEGAAADFEPFIRFHTFGESSIDFTVILRAREFTDTFLLKHEFIKALSARFSAEGIVIPFPIRAINFDQEAGPGAAGPARLEHRVALATAAASDPNDRSAP